jgi:hypothetical protein
MLCTIGEKGKYSSFDMEKQTCLVAGGILELLMDEIAVLEENKISVVAPLSPDQSYLQILYDQIQNKQPVKLERVVEAFSFSFSDKNLQALISGIGDALERSGCVQKEIGGLFGKTILYVPDAKAKDTVIQNIRAELLEDGEISEDVVALTALLNKSGDLSRYFSSYEKKNVNARLKEIKNSAENQVVTQIVEYIETLFALIIIAAT